MPGSSKIEALPPTSKLEREAGRPPSGARAEDNRGLVRVATQYWKGDVRVCELECSGRIIDIHISRPESGGWIVEGHSNHTEQAVVVAGSGASPSEALLDLGARWVEQAPALGLPDFDWKALVEVLRAVNASD